VCLTKFLLVSAWRWPNVGIVRLYTRLFPCSRFSSSRVRTDLAYGTEIPEVWLLLPRRCVMTFDCSDMRTLPLRLFSMWFLGCPRLRGFRGSLMYRYNRVRLRKQVKDRSREHRRREKKTNDEVVREKQHCTVRNRNPRPDTYAKQKRSMCWTPPYIKPT
jgi:hypothetical protein